MQVSPDTNKDKVSEAPFVIVENGIEETQSLSPLIPVADGEVLDSEAAKKKAEADNGE